MKQIYERRRQKKIIYNSILETAALYLQIELTISLKNIWCSEHSVFHWMMRAIFPKTNQQQEQRKKMERNQIK